MIKSSIDRFFKQTTQALRTAWDTAYSHSQISGNPHNTTAADVGAAPSSQGVTNGNIHDHIGGDGAQIDHCGLSNIGSNTHAQVDSHIANTSNPHSVSKTQVGLGNVTDEAQVVKSIGTGKGSIIGFSAASIPGQLLPGTDGHVLTLDSLQTLGIKWAAGGSSSPLITKGDLYGFDTDDARVPVGNNGTRLEADSSQSLGVKWTSIVDGFMERISPVNETTKAFTVTINSNDHYHYKIIGRCKNDTGSGISIYLYFNGDTTATNYYSEYAQFQTGGMANGRLNNPSICYLGAGQECNFECDIHISPSGYPSWYSHVERYVQSASMIEQLTYAGAKTAIIASITGLSIGADVANGLRNGSTFDLYRKH